MSREALAESSIARARIAVLDAHAELEQPFLVVRPTQPRGAIGAMPKKVQIRSGLDAIQYLKGRKDKLQGGLRFVQGVE